MKVALVAVLACSALTVLGPSMTQASASTPCAAASTNRAQSTWLTGAVTASRRVTYTRFTTTSSKWTLIKLGNLKADLQLKLYNASCHLLATSQHSGRRFEQIYRSLPAGRYYLGVSGVSGATSTYDLKFWPISEGVHLLSSHAYITSYRSDLLEIDGEVLNNRSTPNFFRYVTVTFYSSSGHVVARTEGNFPGSYVRAHARASFFAELIKPKQAYSRYTVVTTTMALNGYPAPQSSTIVRSPATRDAQGNLHYPGRITNTSKQPMMLASVEATLYNTYGNVIYVNEGVVSPDTVKPKKTGTFDVVFDKPTGVNGAVLRLPA